MNKVLKVLATSLAMSPALAIAQSSITLYGVMDASIESIKSGDAKVTRLSSGGLTQSRWGLRGSEDLGNGLKATFNVESRINGDDGSNVGGLLFGGRSVVGVSSPWGSLNLGRESNPIYALKALSNPFGLAPYSTAQILMRGGATRSNNAIRYDSPHWHGFKFSGMYTAGDESSVESKAGRHIGASGQYTHGPLWISIGWNRNDVLGATTSKNDEWLLGASYDFGMIKAYLNHWSFKTDSRVNNDTLIKMWTIGASMNFDAHGSLLASYGILSTKEPAVTSGNDARQLTLGYEYNLSRRSTAYIQYVQVTNKNGANFMIGGFANTGVGTSNVSDPRAFQIGLRHTF